MARSRSRSRSRGGSSSFGTSRILVIILLGAFVVGLMVIPTASFSLAALDRGSSVDVVQDQNGVIQLTGPASVSRTATSPVPLVTIKNNIGSDNVQFTVDLLSHTGSDLYLGNSNTAHQGSVTFTLDAGNSQPVKINVDGPGDTLNYKVTATTPNSGFTATLNRDIGVVGGPIKLDIMIKPDEDPNPINMRSRGVIPVAVLNTTQYDIRQLDLNTVRFGSPGLVSISGAGAQPSHNGHFGEDVNGDGRPDLVLHFPTQDTGFQNDDTTGKLVGKLAGADAAGEDSVNVFNADEDEGDEGDEGEGDDEGDDGDDEDEEQEDGENEEEGEDDEEGDDDGDDDDEDDDDGPGNSQGRGNGNDN